MDNNPIINTRETQAYISKTFMSNIYIWMTAALLITAITSFFTLALGIYQLFASQLSFYLCIGAELGLVFFLSSRVHKMSLSTAIISFVTYSILNGLTLSTIFLIYNIQSIAATFLITAGTFGTMSIYGYTTKQDLSSFKNIGYMGLIGLIIATIVNIFIDNSILDTIITYIGVIVFVALTAWDTNKLKAIGEELSLNSSIDSEAQKKYALLGALTLYLDFINLFIYLLRLFGRRS